MSRLQSTSPQQPAHPPPGQVDRVLVATDRSDGAAWAVGWAAALASATSAELIAVEVRVAEGTEGPTEAEGMENHDLAAELQALHQPSRAVTVSAPAEGIAEAIVGQAAVLDADVLVLGNSGMRGRKEFLLGNVANRVTHTAKCTVVIANSSGPETEADAEAAEVPLGARGVEIARALGPVLVEQLKGPVLRSSGDPAAGPRHLREALEELGPTFGKLGQVLSTRPDLIPPDYIEELASLQADVPPMSEAEVVTVMEQELGVPWEDVFGSIEPTPLAAGTIGQVHRATLVDGHRVVVKVQRPTAHGQVETDLSLLERVVAPLGSLQRVRQVIDLPSVVEQLGGALRTELDFTEEAANLRRMADLVARHGSISVPACHDELSTRRLLVMDEVRGVPLREAPASEARATAARQLLGCYFQNVLEDGFFHADPHPGNLMWADDCIWLLDLGMVGRLDAGTRRQLTVLLLAFARGDIGLLADVCLSLSEGDLSDLDIGAFEVDLTHALSGLEDRSLEEIQIVDLLNDLTELSVRHGVPLPADLVLVGKALGQVQLTVAELEPGIDPIEEAGRFFVRSLTRRLTRRFDPEEALYEFEKMRFRLNQIGEGIATVAGNRPGRHVEVGFTSTRLEKTISQAGRTVALGFSAGLTWVAAAVVAGSDSIDPRAKKALGLLATGLSGGLAASLAQRRK